MKLLARSGNEDIASVFIAEFGKECYAEFVESVQPPIPRDKKWVLIVSTLFGCPIACRFCDCGGNYNGRISKEDIFSQIDYLVKLYYPDRIIPIPKFKIQFARMGEPAFNPAVLDVLEEFPTRYTAPGFLPSISTVAPYGTFVFFERLLEIKKRLYPKSFQLQFSIHSTDQDQRNELIPVRKLDFWEMASYGERFFDEGGRKVTLNFALSVDSIIDPSILSEYFDPNIFIIKITPVNPTFTAERNNVNSLDLKGSDYLALCENLAKSGYEVITSIGEVEENKIGSNCGQYITSYLKQNMEFPGAYTYKLNSI